MLNDYAALKARYGTQPKQRVFLQFGSQPLFTTGKGSIQNQVLETCGGENIFAESRVPRPVSVVSRFWRDNRRPLWWSEMRARFLK